MKCTIMHNSLRIYIVRSRTQYEEKYRKKPIQAASSSFTALIHKQRVYNSLEQCQRHACGIGAHSMVVVCSQVIYTVARVAKSNAMVVHGTQSRRRRCDSIT